MPGVSLMPGVTLCPVSQSAGYPQNHRYFENISRVAWIKQYLDELGTEFRDVDGDYLYYIIGGSESLQDQMEAEMVMASQKYVETSVTPGIRPTRRRAARQRVLRPASPGSVSPSREGLTASQPDRCRY
eukprot:COSAG02_NODE_2159_length_9628_cov_7.080596_1_plen_129_part_00